MRPHDCKGNSTEWAMKLEPLIRQRSRNTSIPGTAHRHSSLGDYGMPGISTREALDANCPPQYHDIMEPRSEMLTVNLDPRREVAQDGGKVCKGVLRELLST